MARTQHPFEILPDLVWEIVIQENLDKSSDVFNLLEACPELCQIFNKTEILFFEVLPHIFPELDRKDLRACRFVSKWWNRSVHYFLQNSPYLRNFKLHSFSQKRFSYRYSSNDSPFKNPMFTAVILPKENICQREIELTESHTSAICRKLAFVGRPVILEIDGFQRSNWKRIIPFYKVLQDLLVELGPHISYIYLPLVNGEEQCPEDDHFEDFLKCLAKLPYLKSLSVGVTYILPFARNNGNDKELKEKFVTIAKNFQLPDLPQLDSLEINRHFCGHYDGRALPPEEVYHMLISRYASQLRKLILSMSMWRDEYGNCLKNLTELNVEVASQDKPFSELTKNLNWPCLQKLGIKLTNIFPNSLWSEIQVLPIKILVISTNMHYYLRMWYYTHQNVPLLPNIVSLTLQNYHRSTELPPAFFKSFPSLEYLEITSRDTFGFQGQRRGYNLDAEFTREEISGFWELLPELKILVVGVKRLTREFHNPALK